MSKNLDINEVKKFSEHAEKWWDKDGDLKTLHQINPTRLNFIKQFVDLDNKNIIDIGCGGGILTESLKTPTNKLTGLDASTKAIEIAKSHASQQNLEIDYINETIEDYAQSINHKFDVVTCMEMLEHVPDPESVIKSISEIIAKDGIFFASTLNRNIKSYLLSIIAAEHILNIVPKGTHEYAKFIKPYELVKTAEKYGFKALKISGINYNPILQTFKMIQNADVNYIIAFQKV